MTTIADCISGYEKWLKQQNYSAKSLTIYHSSLARFRRAMAQIGIEHVEDVDKQHLQMYRQIMDDAGLSDNSIYLYLRTVRHLYAHLEQTGVIFLNPACSLALPRFRHKLLSVPSEEEIARVLKQPAIGTATGIRDRAVLELAYSCGLRRDEMARLDTDDIDLSDLRARILGKGNKERIVPIGLEAAKWLRKYLNNARGRLLFNHPRRPHLAVAAAEETALWISRINGRRLPSAGVQSVVRRHGIAAGLPRPLSIHAIRRACATHMLRNGAHPVQIQMLLGHKRLTTLSQYLRITVSDMKRTHDQSKLGK